ncbi:uncharacterized protein LOC110035809 [Phalaenopsis equestris]|uniref:uncharacterized protein LOC110035809 n=1 Tax=Phalaenopsis equestris TaxID=78828 RepID=UPI0009E3B848|nr:uncharacterized protein LOC110035809 [Phalaenopsis equestris]
MKNKWDQMKKEWKIWKELKRSSTSLGWDSVKRTIDAPEEWWAERLAVSFVCKLLYFVTLYFILIWCLSISVLVVPAAKKFKLSGIELKLDEKLDRMFEGVVATGNYACSPCETGFAGKAVNLGTAGGSDDFIDVPSPDQNEYKTISRSKRPRVVDKRKYGASFLRNKLSEVVSCFKAECQTSHSSTIAEAFEILSATTKIYADEELYLFAAESLEEPVRRVFFVQIPAARRVTYIRR